MALRITRRTFVGWLVRSASAAAMAGLLISTPSRVAQGTPHPPPPSPVRGRGGAERTRHPPDRGIGFGPREEAPIAVADGPVSVRMADLVLAGRDLRAGLADGVRLPGQGGDAWGLTAERPGATYTTPALNADFPCTHVGVHWRTDGGDQRGFRVELRASRDGQTWMPWRQVRPEAHGPDRT